MKLSIASVKELSEESVGISGPDSGTRAFHSNDSKLYALFSAPWELHMGATYYGKLQIGPSDAEPQEKIEIPEFKEPRFLIPQCYQPWTSDNNSVLLLTYDAPPVLYNCRSRKTRRLLIKETVHAAAICSPEYDMAFLLNYGNTAHFLTLKADLRPSLSFPLPAQQTRAFWFGDCVLILRQDRKPARIQLYHMDSSTPVADIAIDPSKIAPFDTEKFKKLKKTHSVLKWKSSYMSGTLLDIWERVSFDRGRMALRLSIMRPLGEPYMTDGIEPGSRPELICEVAPLWVEITLESLD